MFRFLYCSRRRPIDHQKTSTNCIFPHNKFFAIQMTVPLELISMISIRKILKGVALVAFATLPTSTSFASTSRPEHRKVAKVTPYDRKAFTATSSSNGLRLSSSSLLGSRSYGDGSDKDHRDALALNKARTDIRNFLTQRAIQSFVFLLIHCRDEATVRWLEVSFVLVMSSWSRSRQRCRLPLTTLIFLLSIIVLHLASFDVSHVYLEHTICCLVVSHSRLEKIRFSESR